MNTYLNKIQKQLNELKLDNILSVAIIVLSIFNIIGDLIEQESVITNDQDKKVIAHNIYTLAVLGSIILYLIFFKRSKNSLDEATNENKDTFPYKVRLIGSIFFIIGILCVFYFTVNETQNIDSPEI